MLTHYVKTCTYAYNRFAGPALNGLVPFQQTYGRTQKFMFEVETGP